MAASHSNSMATRQRPNRMPAESVKPSQVMTTAATSSLPQGILPSNVSTLLTNLRLLDLDLMPDWPNVSSLTFSSKDSGQGQKRRIQCVEWVLYQLFALWDPEEAHSVCC